MIIKSLHKILKTLLRAISLLLILLIIAFNVSLYYNPTFKTDAKGQIYNASVYHQLQFLKTELESGAGREMQKIYPEGFLFINALYGLSWVELITNLSPESDIYQEGKQALAFTLKEINGSSAKAIFSKNLPLEYGAFYRGWTNYVLGKSLSIQDPRNIDSTAYQLFIKNCKDISAALKQTDSPYLESYIDRKWPADGIIAVSSLKLHDQIFNTNDYEDQINDWLSKVKLNLDPKTELIPHYIEASNDKIIEGARGSSQSLILNFMAEIDSSFSQLQFQVYKKHFLDWRMGMPGIREYPKGVKGYGDIDSGPVILNIGGAASIVGQRTMGKYGDWLNYQGLRNCIQTFGVGMTNQSEKKFLFGQLPMADAFIVWSNSIEHSVIHVKETNNWRIKSQLFSIVLLVLLGWILVKINHD